ncbi:MFS transporter [Streptomyces qinzhouensis]|uniref:MFS transporter n=1 Tax=Streptomyces qinzhouensis TaxID=2599401 RepID=A0A5B8JJD2_9ACTN|nr:MFS transporter [Streptomyces qinzhouensis]QDY80554.1 MFS transporter [Streptomyces qinzhouensis]
MSTVTPASPPPATAPPPPRGGLPAVVAVTLGIFAIVTTEILPIGLLTSIGSDFTVSDGTAGLTMTMPGLLAAVAAPVVTVATGRYDRRRMLVLFLLLLAGANLLAATATGYGAVLVSRILVGLVIGGFWSVAAGLAARLVPERSVRRATAVIFSAVPLGSVLGVPLGTLVGDAYGRRTAFAAMAVFTLGTLLLVVVTVPPLPAVEVTRGAVLRDALRAPGTKAALVFTFLVVLAHFGAYTYVTPFLEEVSGAGPMAVTLCLLGFGAAGIAGTFLGGTVVGRRPRTAFAGAGVLLAAAVLALPVLGGSTGPAAVLLLVWGVAYGAVPVCSQAWFARAVPRAPEAASVLFTASFQATISLGALMGGVAVDRHSPAAAMVLGGATAALMVCAVVAHAARGPRLRRP